MKRVAVSFLLSFFRFFFSNYEIRRLIAVRAFVIAPVTADFRERKGNSNYGAKNMSHAVEIASVRPAIKYKLHVAGKNRSNRKAEGAIGWKYDSPLSGILAKFTSGVIDIGTADSLLRTVVR